MFLTVLEAEESRAQEPVTEGRARQREGGVLSEQAPPWRSPETTRLSSVRPLCVPGPGLPQMSLGDSQAAERGSGRSHCCGVLLRPRFREASSPARSPSCTAALHLPLVTRGEVEARSRGQAPESGVQGLGASTPGCCQLRATGPRQALQPLRRALERRGIAQPSMGAGRGAGTSPWSPEPLGTAQGSCPALTTSRLLPPPVAWRCPWGLQWPQLSPSQMSLTLLLPKSSPGSAGLQGLASTPSSLPPPCPPSPCSSSSSPCSFFPRSSPPPLPDAPPLLSRPGRSATRASLSLSA